MLFVPQHLLFFSQFPISSQQDKDTYGGSFLYHLEEDTPLVAVGFVVGYTMYAKHTIPYIHVQ